MSWGTTGTGDGQFILPHGVVVDSHGDLYVSERGNARIQKFDSNGNFLMKWGSEGTGDGQFSHMEHIAIDSSDNIYVADPQSDASGNGIPRIQKFASNGTFITKWGSFGKGDGQFVDPEHIAVDSKGFVYVTDRSNNNVQKFAPVG
jgi:DNA-binding beta-propeller fold protein YncE